MRFLPLFAALLLSSCVTPGPGPAELIDAPPEQPETETAAAVQTASPAAEETSSQGAPGASEAAQAPASDVEALRRASLSSAQLVAVQTGLREALRDETLKLDRVAAGESALGVIFVCGYAAAGSGGGSQAFRGVLMGKDSAQPKFVAVRSAVGADQQSTAQVCEAQGIPLSAARPADVTSASLTAESTAPASTIGGEAAEGAPAAGTDAAAAEIVAPSAPLPKVVLTGPQINAVQAGVRTTLSAPSAVFGRMLAGADAKGGIVVCGFVSPLNGGSAGAAIQPFTGVLIGEGDRRNFVPVGFGRDETEKQQTMEVCESQGIPL